MSLSAICARVAGNALNTDRLPRMLAPAGGEESIFSGLRNLSPTNRCSIRTQERGTSPRATEIRTDLTVIPALSLVCTCHWPGVNLPNQNGLPRKRESIFSSTVVNRSCGSERLEATSGIRETTRLIATDYPAQAAPASPRRIEYCAHASEFSNSSAVVSMACAVPGPPMAEREGQVSYAPSASCSSVATYPR